MKHSARQGGLTTAEPPAPLPPAEDPAGLAREVRRAYLFVAEATFLDERYGSRLNAVRAVGAAVEQRAAQIAGLSPDDVRHRFEARWAAAVKAARGKPDDNPAWAHQATVYQGEDEETRADLARLAEGYRLALAEIRQMGGRLAIVMPEEFGEDPVAAAALERASAWFPTDWIEASNSAVIPLYLAPTGARGHYSHLDKYADPATPDDWRPVGALSLSRGRETTAAIHELSHRAEFVVADLHDIEDDFLLARTTLPDGTRESLRPLGYPYGRDEQAWFDAFSVRYSGRSYPRGTEVLSVGWEALAAGEYGGLVGASRQYKADADMRAVCLGALASAGLS